MSTIGANSVHTGYMNSTHIPPLVLIVGCLASGCTAIRGRIHVFPRCADGLPVQILTDPACPPDSICGYSCLPGRWTLGEDGCTRLLRRHGAK